MINLPAALPAWGYSYYVYYIFIVMLYMRRNVSVIDMQLLELKSLFCLSKEVKSSGSGRKVLGTVIWTKLDRLGDSYWSSFGSLQKSSEG